MPSSRLKKATKPDPIEGEKYAKFPNLLLEELKKLRANTSVELDEVLREEEFAVVDKEA